MCQVYALRKAFLQLLEDPTMAPDDFDKYCDVAFSFHILTPLGEMSKGEIKYGCGCKFSPSYNTIVVRNP